jgi:hypothetical protein
MITSIERSPYSEPNSTSARQELLHIFWNPLVHCLFHHILPFVPLLSHMNPVHAIPSYLWKIHLEGASCPLCWFNNKEFCVLHVQSKHNYILPISTVRIQLHVSALYVWAIFRLRFLTYRLVIQDVWGVCVGRGGGGGGGEIFF